MYLRGGGPEAEAGGGVLLLTDPFDPRAEVELHVEALLRRDVLWKGRASRHARLEIGELILGLCNSSIFFFGSNDLQTFE